MNKKITIESDIKNIFIVENLIEDINTTFNLNSNIYGNMLISVLEAITNSIIHGNKNNPTKTVSLNFEALSDRFVFIVEDQGTGFDISLIPDPTTPLNVEKPDGRGVFLMKKLSDEILFEENGKRVILSFFRC